MSIIISMGSFTLEWNLSKSGEILGWLLLHIKAKFQNKTKTKPRKIFATSSSLFFCQVRCIIKKQTQGPASNCVITNFSCEKSMIFHTSRKYVHCAIKANLKTKT